MRILVADHNALLLAAIARTFGRHCEVVVATDRDACVAHIEERGFDVVVACEKLRDYTGLELLGEVTALSPRTLRVFAARPETLKRLGPRLDHFGLLGTLSYPIDARKLLLALKAAREKLAALPKRPKPKIRHVVLEENEWDTGERLGLLERELEAAKSGAADPSSDAPQGSEPLGDRDAPRAAGDPAAWEMFAGAPSPVPAVGPQSEDASFEVSFDEMPGQRIPVAPKRSRQNQSSEVARAAPHAAPPRKESAPKVTAPNGSVPTAAVDDAVSSLEIACNDPDIEAPLPVDTFGAANEPLFENGTASRSRQQGETSGARATSARGAQGTADARDASGARGDAKAAGTKATGTTASGGSTAAAAGGTRKSVPNGPKVRKPTQVTAAQREAFQQALARRNAAKRGGGLAPGGFATGVGFDFRPAARAATGITTDSPVAPTPFISSQSLTDIARMATRKLPLKQINRGLQQPKRRVIVYGSGVAAALLAVVVFQLMKATPGEHGHHRHVQEANTHLFSPDSTLVAASNTPAPQVFTPTPPHVDAPTSAPSESPVPQPERFDPDTAPPDPPPPPAYQGPGPMEPPSIGHRGPPLGMQGMSGEE